MQQRSKKLLPMLSSILLGSLIGTSALAVTTINIPDETNSSSSHTTSAPSSSTWNPHPIANPWYIGGDLGVGESADSDIGIAGGIYAGYAINSNISAEFNFLAMPFTDNNNNYLFAGNAKISLPLANSLMAFGKIGLGGMKSPEKSRLALLMGGGVDYYLPNNISVGAQLLGTVGATTAQSFSILSTASYYFGNPI